MGWTVRASNPGGGGEIFRTCPDRPWGPPSLLYNGYRVFPGGKKRPGRDADPSPPSSAVGQEMVRTAWTEPQCLYTGALLTQNAPPHPGSLLFETPNEDVNQKVEHDSKTAFFVQLRYVIQHACTESIVTGTLAEIKGHPSKNPLTSK